MPSALPPAPLGICIVLHVQDDPYELLFMIVFVRTAGCHGFTTMKLSVDFLTFTFWDEHNNKLFTSAIKNPRI